METPGGDRRKSLRTRQSLCYAESPKNASTSEVTKSAKTAETKTPSKERKPLGRSRKKKTYDTQSDSETVEESPEAPKTTKGSKTPNAERKPVGRPRRKSTYDEHGNYSPKKLRLNRTPSTKCLENVGIEKELSPVDSPRRRSTRVRTPNRRIEQIYQVLTKNMTPKSTKDEMEESMDVESVENSSGSDYESDEKENLMAKSSTLFNEEQDVEGKKLYSFKTPKKKDGMSNLANQTPKTPRHHDPNRTTPRTPKNSRISDIQNTPTSRPSAGKCTKTPRHIRDQIRTKLYKVQYQEDSEDDGDFKASESEFEASSESESSSGEEEEAPSKKESLTARVLKTPATSAMSARATRAAKRNKGPDYNFVLQSDEFFSTQAQKTKTSDHTLDKLKNPRLPHDQLIKLLSKMEMSEEHQVAVKELNEEYKTYFDKWLNLLKNGYTILLHGLGSKRNLMQAFHKERLSKEHVLVVNGFFPSLTIKDILEQLANDLLELSVSTTNSHEVINMIEEEMRLIPELEIYLLIHNLDGLMLRNDKAQSVLSRLASIERIHMVASIDHINTPLLWNNTKLNNYNFIWFDVTTYLPYTDETAFENSLLINNSGALELSSMKSVFQSLTSNAKGIYMMLVKYQLKNSSNQNYQGMVFKELYSACREAFLVSSDVALRAQLTEFLDHKLARIKRSVDGSENITIPINNALLQKFMNEQS